MSLLSISIDLANSTKTKREICHVSRGDIENIRKCYADMAKQLYRMEANLYFQAANGGLDLHRFFVVKTIGDEIWIVYDLAEIPTHNLKEIPLRTLEFNTVFLKLLNALIDVTSREYHICITSRKLTLEEENNTELQTKSEIKFVNKELRPKIYFDIIRTYQEVSSVRNEIYSEKLLGEFFKAGKNPKAIDYKEIGDIIERLYIGTIINWNGAKVQTKFRFDPLGFDVDCFFRYTKAAESKHVACGKNLIDELDISKPWPRSLCKLHKNCELIYGLPGALKYEYLKVKWKKLSKEKCKGLKDDYLVAFLNDPERKKFSIT